MQLEAIRMNFVTPVHLGRGQEELDKTELIYHSDSLKSAIYSVGLPLFPEWQNTEQFFQGFQISSCFPYARNEYFFPKPMINKGFDFLNDTSPENMSKKAKKIRFLSKRLFEQFLNSNSDRLLVDENNITADNLFLCEHSETCNANLNNGRRSRISFFREEIQQRVVVASEQGQEITRPFYFERIYFERDCGLFFLAQFHDQKLKKHVLHAIKILGENGIGTDRTVGNGLFQVEFSDDGFTPFTFNLDHGRMAKIPLGLYLPTKEEIKQIDFSGSMWSLVKRGGYMAGSDQDSISHLRKKSIYMFMEGSTFKTEIQLKGSWTNLKPEWNTPLHPVFRCGMPIII